LRVWCVSMVELRCLDAQGGAERVCGLWVIVTWDLWVLGYISKPISQENDLGVAAMGYHAVCLPWRLTGGPRLGHCPRSEGVRPRSEGMEHNRLVTWSGGTHGGVGERGRGVPRVLLVILVLLLVLL
jgi:hypothetical protein